MKHLKTFERFVEPDVKIKNKMDDLIDSLLKKYGGDKEFFDALDDSIRDNLNEYMLYRYYESINEGLTRSYPPEFIKRKLIEMGVDAHDINIMYDKEESSELIRMEVKANKPEGFWIDIINKMENLFGWFLSGYRHDDFDEIDTGVEYLKDFLEYNLEQMRDEYPEEIDDIVAVDIYFEPKFTKPQKTPKKLYHITDRKFLSKIEKQGLVPKSKRKQTYHPERIYLLKDIRKVSDLLNHHNFSIDDPVLLTIDTNGLDIKLMNDPLMPEGVYTQDLIPPKNIISVKPI